MASGMPPAGLRVSKDVPRSEIEPGEAAEVGLRSRSRSRRAKDPKRLPKIALTRLGAMCSARLMYELNGVYNYLHVGWWLSAHGFRPAVRTRTREELFDLVANEIGDRLVLYLEFGVHEGDSMRCWANLLRNPRSHLHGFDSFLGLPHDWSLEGHERGHFSTGGHVPKIQDPRVGFYPGWFEDTLPRYEWPEHEVLVVMLDADLYSSTATALSFVREKLVPGSYLYFDQFHHRADELRAFSEFVDEHGMRFSLVGASRELSAVLFQRLG
jgi:Macrocin-O-methyltransferase (TylF)